MKHLRALVALAFFALAWPAAAYAQAQPQPVLFTVTPGVASPVFYLSGASTCAVVVLNGPTAGALIPQAASDPIANVASAQWTTVTTINSGSIGTFGEFVGNVAAAGLTMFRVAPNATMTGTAIGSIYCSTSLSTGAAGSSGSITSAGTNGTQAQAVQGITGGVPVAVTSSAGSTGAPQYTRIQDGTTTNLATVLASGADATSNTTGAVGSTSLNYGYNGTTWDRLRSTLAFQGLAVGILAVDSCSTSATTTCQTVDVTKHAYVTSGGGAAAHLTSASPTTCTSSSVAAGNRLIGVTNASSTAQTATLTLYDEGASPTCVLADQVYQVVLGSSQIVAFANGGILLTSGLAYTLSATLTNPIVIQRAQ